MSLFPGVQGNEWNYGIVFVDAMKYYLGLDFDQFFFSLLLCLCADLFLFSVCIPLLANRHLRLGRSGRHRHGTTARQL